MAELRPVVYWQGAMQSMHKDAASTSVLTASFLADYGPMMPNPGGMKSPYVVVTSGRTVCRE
jgi:hypothetical protein